MQNTADSIKVVHATAADFEAITEVWEASVRATHHFLKEEDVLLLKPLIRNEYLYAVNVFCIKDTQAQIIGFMGTSEDKIEMLFINPDSMGKGIGKVLLQYAVQTLGIRKLDVNKQNEQAVGFYSHVGFAITGRSERDSMGKPYPILHMELKT